jgi:hypothetical protein
MDNCSYDILATILLTLPEGYTFFLWHLCFVSKRFCYVIRSHNVLVQRFDSINLVDIVRRLDNHNNLRPERNRTSVSIFDKWNWDRHPEVLLMPYDDEDGYDYFFSYEYFQFTRNKRLYTRDEIDFLLSNCQQLLGYYIGKSGDIELFESCGMMIKIGNLDFFCSHVMRGATESGQVCILDLLPLDHALIYIFYVYANIGVLKWLRKKGFMMSGNTIDHLKIMPLKVKENIMKQTIDTISDIIEDNHWNFDDIIPETGRDWHSENRGSNLEYRYRREIDKY